MEFTGIDDIEYLRNKLMAALKIPKAFLGYEEELSGKATLASEDVRFARTIQRIQRILISELEKIAIVHLYSQGYRDETLVKFKLELTNPSTIFEKEKIEVWTNKTELARQMQEIKLYSKNWIYKNVFNLADDESEELLEQIVEDSKQSWRFKSIEEEGNDPAKPFQKINPQAQGGLGGGMGGPPGDLGGMGGPGGIPELPGSEGGLGGPGGGLGGPPGGPGGLPPLEEAQQKGETNHVKWQQMGEEPVEEGHGEHADDWVRPSQKGEKDATKYPFGEDPLGNKENNEKPRPGRELTHKFKNDSPLSLEYILKNPILKNLQSYLDKTKSEKRELIKESENNKSLLDESNIIDE
jgi:hypothetical protein